MLKTSSIESAEPRKSIVGVGDDGRARHDKSKIIDNEVDDEVDDKVGKKDRNPCKSKNLSKSKKTESGYLTSGVRIAFTKFRQAFIKVPILYHFNPERFIRVEKDVSGYAIDAVFSQLTLDDLNQ